MVDAANSMKSIKVDPQTQKMGSDMFVAAGSIALGLTPVDALVDAGSLIKNVFTGNFGGAAADLGALFGADIIKDGKKIVNVLEQNKAIGKKGEELVSGNLAKEFKDDKVLQQVTGKFEAGGTTVFDDVVIDSKTAKTKLTNETKTGNSTLSDSQQRYRNGEKVTLVGKNAGDAKGQTISTNTTPDRVTRVNPEDLK